MNFKRIGELHEMLESEAAQLEELMKQRIKARKKLDKAKDAIEKGQYVMEIERIKQNERELFEAYRDVRIELSKLVDQAL